MKYKMEIKLNIGNYQSLLIGVEDADSLASCRQELIDDIKRIHNDNHEFIPTKTVMASLGMKKSDLL